ncbi:sulfotransferase domain-containing protein [Glycocaulis profundi]|nr:sulfotransferase domain-containing protein [Glycocaulis profundi]
MLIVCNGAQKSGSTWVTEIVAKSGWAEKIPDRHCANSGVGRSFPDDVTHEIIDDDIYISENYYCKQHWIADDKYLEFAKKPHVKFINIIRDVRDMLVSRYFHDVRREVFTGSLDDYFDAGLAETRVRAHVRYHRFWHQGEGRHHTHMMSYERLHEDFKGEVKDLCDYLELNVSDIDAIAEKLRSSTDFKNKPSGPDKFYRSGATGDHENHLTSEHNEKVEAALEAMNFLKVKQKIAEDHPGLKPYLSSIDIGI